MLDLAENYRRVMGSYPWEPRPDDPPEIQAALEEVTAMHEDRLVREFAGVNPETGQVWDMPKWREEQSQ